MSLTCPKCRAANRDGARFCKRCGTSVAASSGPSLESLVGLEAIKQRLEERARVIERMRQDGALIRMNYHTVLVGNSGTGKTLIANLLFELLRRGGALTQKAASYRNAPDFSAMALPDIEDLFARAKGGAIIVDNVHDLVRADGQMDQGLKKLLGELDKNGPDPVVILCGLPQRLREFLQKEENSHVAGRFREVLFVSDYSSETMGEIVRAELAAKGFSLSPEARARLAARCRRLVKESRQPQSALGARNGYLAKKEAEELIQAYYLRGGGGRLLQPEDIRGEVEEAKSLEQVMARLEELVGMATVKSSIRDLHARLRNAQRWASEGRPQERPNLNAVITGNPGTGKTSLAPLLGEIYAALGVLDTGHVVMADRAALVAGFVGQTAIKTNALCDQAMGGVLFVDEAYALKQSDDDAFGDEAIVTLLKRAEDDRGKFACVVAGYRDEMHRFLSANPGLESRFPSRFHFEDYSAEELLEIFRRAVKGGGRRLAPGAEARARALLEAKVARKGKSFANGREARNLLDETLRRLNQRLATLGREPSREELGLILAEDVPAPGPEGGASAEQALARLEGLVGLEGVKRRVRELIDTLEVARLRGEQGPLSAHFVFLGNPGTGKTTVARILADVFHAIGLLPTNSLVEVDRAALVSSVPNETSKQVHKLCDQALGGVLFIDEAYALRQNEYDASGKEAIDTLLKRMEDDRGKFVVVAAGYTKEMHDFLASNPGLPSRFTNTIEFEDYSAEQMARIFESQARQKGLELEPGLGEALLRLFRSIEARKTAGFANARTVRQQFDKTCERLAGRVVALKRSGASEEACRAESRRIRASDLPDQGGAGRRGLEEVLAELDAQVGLDGVKAAVRRLLDRLELARLRGREQPLNAHMVFTGNPGTGKTSIARILAEVFQVIGLLPTNRLIEVARSDLVGKTIGSTAPLVQEACNRAMGGVLFIDEAYTLASGGRSSNDFGQEAIDTLLKRMADDEGKFVVIAAGYPREMQAFIDSNSGLKSRFSFFVDFEDYGGEQLTRIFESFARKQGYRLAPEARAELLQRMVELHAARDANFGNARTAKRAFEEVEGRLSARILRLRREGMAAEALRQAANLITLEDLGPRGEGAWA